MYFNFEWMIDINKKIIIKLTIWLFSKLKSYNEYYTRNKDVNTIINRMIGLLI